MGTTGYRRLAIALACICVLVTLALGFVCYRYSRLWVDHARIRAEYRYAHDIVFSFEADRDLALKREVTNAVEFCIGFSLPRVRSRIPPPILWRGSARERPEM
jgi:hypothetical protein